MDLRQLRAVVAVARSGGFTRAADELGVAQPALSQAVAALERELGIALFERTSRRVRATPAGTAFSLRAERILDDVEALRSEMAEHAGVVRGRIVIGSLQQFSETMLPPIVAAFHRAHPAVEITLREDLSQQMLEGLRAGRLDCAIINAVNVADRADYADVVFTPLGRDPLALAVGPAHRLAKRRRVTLRALRNEAWVTFRRGSGLHATLIDATRKEGYRPRIVVESGDNVTVRSLVAEGIGIAVLPRSFLETPGAPVAVLDLEPRLERATALAMRRSAPPNAAARAFAQFLRKSLG